MNFSDLRLATAIYHVSFGPGARVAVRDGMSFSDQHEYAREVALRYSVMFETTKFQWEADEVVNMAVSMRKGGSDTQTKAKVAWTHGMECFWTGRGKGPCSEDAECGHLVPRSKGGDLSVANCVIECRAHNNQRRAMTIEEYLANDSLNTSIP